MVLPGSEETDGVEGTERLGAELAAVLRSGQTVLVSGDLGAGKTVFVRGACRALGIESPITSPTFTLARRYDGGRIPVSHLDLYRLADGMPGEDPGILEEEAGPDRLTFIEWPERLPDRWLEPDHRVLIEHLGGDRRRVTVE